MHAVVERVQDDPLRVKTPSTRDPHQGADRRDPLADAEGQDRRPHREPDEGEREQVLPDAGQRREEVAERGDGEDRQHAAEPDRVREPVEDRVDRGGEAPERELDPDVGAALLGEREPSSAVSSAYGTKKKTPRNASQVNACAPSLETAPSVSRPTSVQIRKKKMSKRPKCFCSFAFSSSAALVVWSTSSSARRWTPWFPLGRLDHMIQAEHGPERNRPRVVDNPDHVDRHGFPQAARVRTPARRRAAARGRAVAARRRLRVPRGADAEGRAQGARRGARAADPRRRRRGAATAARPCVTTPGSARRGCWRSPTGRTAAAVAALHAGADDYLPARSRAPSCSPAPAPACARPSSAPTTRCCAR